MKSRPPSRRIRALNPAWHAVVTTMQERRAGTKGYIQGGGEEGVKSELPIGAGQIAKADGLPVDDWGCIACRLLPVLRPQWRNLVAKSQLCRPGFWISDCTGLDVIGIPLTSSPSYLIRKLSCASMSTSTWFSQNSIS